MRCLTSRQPVSLDCMKVDMKHPTDWNKSDLHHHLQHALGDAIAAVWESGMCPNFNFDSNDKSDQY